MWGGCLPTGISLMVPYVMTSCQLGPVFTCILCFAGWLSECTANHTKNNTLWSNVEYFHHKVCIFLLCGVQFTYTLQLAA